MSSSSSSSSSSLATSATMLRPRRPRSAISSSLSLREYSCHSSSDTTAQQRWDYCPDHISMDESQSSSSFYSESEDEEYAMITEHYNYLPQHQQQQLLLREKNDVLVPLCRVSNHREKQKAHRALVVRTIMTLVTIVMIVISSCFTTTKSTNRQSSSSSNNISEATATITTSTTTTTTTPQPQPQRNTQIRKRRLVEVAIPKPSSVIGTTTLNQINKRVRNGKDAVTISIAQKANIHRTAMKQLIDQYGMGPHLVEFQIRTWSDDTTDTAVTAAAVGTPPTPSRSIISYFTIEMAPVHMMPITVHTFLQQISSELWDNTSFHYNTEHLLAAHSKPATRNNNNDVAKFSQQQSRRHMMLTTTTPLRDTIPLSYTEYNRAYPHLPYTLGLIGNNGPDFYINKVLNHHQDPCFANVVIGRSTIDALFRIRQNNNDRVPHRIRPVEIITARIIQSKLLTPTAMDEYVQTTIAP